ncbi:MAG: hypothetical protein IKJ30_05480 [Bacilli bacterium]|nr:hypothetical protein [Bacilli bacterium]
MNTLISVLKIYDINRILIRNDEVVDIVILDRKRVLSLNDWINLNIALKRFYKKEVNYLSKSDAKVIYKDLSLFEEVSYE